METTEPILLIHSSLQEGGSCKIMITHANILNEYGFKIIVCGKRGNLLENLNNNIKYYQLSPNFNDGFYIKKVFYYFVVLIKLYNIVKINNIKLIVNNDRYTLIISSIISKIFKIKHYSVAHGEYQGKKFLCSSLWGRRVLAVSSGTMKNLLYQYGLSFDKIILVRNSIPPMQRSNAEYLKKYREKIDIGDNDIVCCIANFDPVKNHKFLINAWNEIYYTFPKLKLLLVGKNGSLRYEVEEMVKQSRGNIKIISEDQKISKLIDISLFTILASYREGLPNVILESFSLGKPVIGSNVSGINEIVINNYNGILFRLNDIGSIINAIRKIYLDYDYRKMLSSNALYTYNNSYNYHDYKKKIIGFYTI